MDKLNFMGVGPKIGMIALPWLAVSIIFTVFLDSKPTFFKNGNNILFYIGFALIITGGVMYFLSALTLLKGLKKTFLVTNGTYYFCCNPLYSALILFIIPGISFMMNSWLILTTSIVAYVSFKIFIKNEYAEMEKFFGKDYIKYKNETPELFPFPVKKLFRSE
jgi:protein-S-isoprenylcysteine O-methyltransferase Ste14